MSRRRETDACCPLGRRRIETDACCPMGRRRIETDACCPMGRRRIETAWCMLPNEPKKERNCCMLPIGPKKDRNWCMLGLATEFRSEKIPRNSLGTDSVIPRKKVLIPTEFRIPRKSPFRSSERNGTEFRGKIVFRNSQKNDLSVPQKSSLSGTLLQGGLFPARITQKYKSNPGKIFLLNLYFNNTVTVTSNYICKC
jgi:hypothetical protein